MIENGNTGILLTHSRQTSNYANNYSVEKQKEENYKFLSPV